MPKLLSTLTRRRILNWTSRAPQISLNMGILWGHVSYIKLLYWWECWFPREVARVSSQPLEQELSGTGAKLFEASVIYFLQVQWKQLDTLEAVTPPGTQQFNFLYAMSLSLTLHSSDWNISQIHRAGVEFNWSRSINSPALKGARRCRWKSVYFLLCL